MGANHSKDKEATRVLIRHIDKMPEEARGVLSHHVNNSMQPIISGIQSGNLEMALKAARHLHQDLIGFGLIVDPERMRMMVEKLKRDAKKTMEVGG